MIKIENTDTYGWEAAIRGMRNPMNSWDKTDTIYGEYYGKDENGRDILVDYDSPIIGNNDYRLMSQLADAGQVHGKYLRMITVTCDITAPLYWWKEFDTYKVGTVANSCSTMHKIQSKEFTLDDFSVENLPEDVIDTPFKDIIKCLNFFRDLYNREHRKDDWWVMIQLLPSSYNQKRTVQLNYAVLKNIYEYRRNHKLDEWHTFCEWIEQLPYASLITMEVG